MRCVDRRTFLTLPIGTAYCKGGKWHFEGLCFKGETLGNDWYERDPAWIAMPDSGECFVRLEDMLANGASHRMQTSECRDGLFDEDAIFLVLERGDLEALRGWIDGALACA